MNREAHHLMQPILLILTASLLLTGCSKKPSAPVNQTVDVATNSAASQNASSPTNASPSAAPVDMTQTINRCGTRASYFDKITQFPAWKTVPLGHQQFDGVPLDIEGMICLWGEGNAVKLHIVFPEAILGIVANQKFETLYVYHGSFFASPDGTPVCSVVFRYTDGSSATNQMLYGEDIIDWVSNSDGPIIAPSGSRSKLAWVGGSFMPYQNVPLRLCLTAIENPKPSVEVETIDLYSCKSLTAACIMAMTAGQSGLLK